MDTELRSELLHQLDHQIRRNCRFIGRKVEQLERVTRVTGPSTETLDNVIMWSDLNGDTIDPEIDQHIAWFEELGHHFHWLAYQHDQPGDLVDCLIAKGFEKGITEEVVIAAAADIEPCAAPAGIEIRFATKLEQLPDVIEVQDQVWGAQYHDFLLRWLSDTLRDHSEAACIVTAYDGEKPVGSAWGLLWPDRPFAPLFGGSVLPDWRGRGIYRAMIAARAACAAEKQIPWCLVDAGPESLPVLLKTGFCSLTTRTSMNKIK